MNPLIAAEHLTIIRDQRNILDDVSLAVYPEDFITIIGPNGAGKSMLLHCLLGFYSPDRGSVSRKPDLKIGYVPQRLAVTHTLPISAGRFLQLRKNADRAEVEKIAEMTSTHHLLNTPLYTLSGGELQRILLARALLGQPELLVLDEPAQNVDIAGQLALYTLLERIYEERKLSILMVSHDLHLVMSSTKQVVCLYHHVCCSGAPQVVREDPEFISLFGAGMNRMMAIYQHDHDHRHDHDE